MRVSLLVAFPKVNISGVNRLALLKALWEQQPPALFYDMNTKVPIPKWDEKAATEALKHGYIDYFCGRCIKTDLSNDVVDTTEYDEQGLTPSFRTALDRARRLT